MAGLDLDSLRSIADNARAIADPIRTIAVTITKRTWTGRIGVEPHTDETLALPKFYKVRIISQREIASSGGLYLEGDIRVGPITPPHTGGGFSQAQLRPDGAKNIEVIYVLTGDFAGDYRDADASGFCLKDGTLQFYCVDSGDVLALAELSCFAGIRFAFKDSNGAQGINIGGGSIIPYGLKFALQTAACYLHPAASPLTAVFLGPGGTPATAVYGF